jgi:DNA-binding transcriptional regulator YiaG
MINKQKTIASPDSLTQDWDDFKAGRAKFRTWRIDSKTHKRTMSFKGIEDIRHEKAIKLKELRSKELGLSQSQLAQAIHVSPRTLQGWEIGRSLVPEPVLLLLQLMKDIPAIRRRLIHAH